MNSESNDKSNINKHVPLPQNKTETNGPALPSVYSSETKEDAATSAKTFKSTKRTKRDTLGSPIFVETAVFVDRDLFDHMKTNFPTDTERELIRFILAMINAVSVLLFRFISSI